MKYANEIKQIISLFITNELGIKTNNILENENFFNTYDINSFDSIKILTILEKEISFEINENDLKIDKLNTIKKINKYIKESKK